MSLKEDLKTIKDAGVVLYKSKRTSFGWFLPATKDELPQKLSEDDNLKTQSYGTHYTELGISNLAKSLKQMKILK